MKHTMVKRDTVASWPVVRCADLCRYVCAALRRLLGSSTLLLILATRAFAANESDACVDRLSAPGRAAGEFDRIAQMRYDCVRLGNGKRVWVAQAGKAELPAVLLIHGLGNNAHRDWRSTAPELASHFRVIALDLPGFGASDALASGYAFADIDAVLVEMAQRLGLRRFHLVGHSLGGAIALHFAHRHPGLVDKLVLANAAGILLKPVFVRHLLEANASASGLGSLSEVLSVFGQDDAGLMDLLGDESGLSRVLLQDAAVRSALFGTEVHADAALGLVEHDFSAAIRELRTPTTIIWGADDTVTPLRTAKVLLGRLQNARLEVLPGAQHMPMMQQPAAFNRALIKALTEPFMRTAPAAVAATAQGEVVCRNQANMRYSGAFTRLSLENCSNARIENAHIGQLRIERSSVRIENARIQSEEVALDISSSSLLATATQFDGRVAIRAQDSTLDLAGVYVRGRDRGVEALRSRAYFSVSEYQAPEYRGDAHFVWPGTITPP